MPKFFVVSDIHGFYDELITALDKSGFDKYNSDHWLISCGDNFDRGPKPVEVMQYLISLPRKILVRGNHESLLQDLCEAGYPGSHDISNGTYDTVCKFGGEILGRSFEECCIITEQRTKNFIYSMKQYFETKNYIFVHGWIPVICKDGLPMYHRRNRKFEFNPEWRNAHFSEWEQARWLNGIDMARKHFVEPEKTIVCGHWHCSYGHMMDDMAKNGLFNCIDEFGDTAIWEPYYGDGIIALDKCVAYTGEINALVIEDVFMDG